MMQHTNGKRTDDRARFLVYALVWAVIMAALLFTVTGCDDGRDPAEQTVGGFMSTHPALGHEGN